MKEGKKDKDGGKKKFRKNEVGEERKRENLGDRQRLQEKFYLRVSSSMASLTGLKEIVLDNPFSPRS